MKPDAFGYSPNPMQKRNPLELELCTDSVRFSLPLPLLSTRPLNTLIHTTEFQGESGTQLLQTSSDAFGTLHLLPVGANDCLLRLALLAEDVTMPTDEDVITLVVKCHDLAAFELRLRGEEPAEQVRCQKTQGSAEVVQDQLGPVFCGTTMTGKALALDPIADAEVEGWSNRKVDHCQAAGLLLVLIQHDQSSELAIRSELGNLTD